jgi:small GTP-binding protein
MNDNILAINIFDFSGDNDYKAVRKTFYSDATCVVLVFDVNIKTTFESLSQWEKEAEVNGLDLKKSVVLLIGNKCDGKKREVKTESAKELAKSRGYIYYETSAKNGTNINEAFKVLFDNVYNRIIDIRAKYIY